MKISFDFDTPKYNAMHMQLSKNGQTVEGELISHTQKLYEKCVPKEVRAFLEYMTGTAPDTKKTRNEE